MDNSKYTLNLGLGITGSFCTHPKLIKFLSDIKTYDYNIIPIFSQNAGNTDSRFGSSSTFTKEVEELTGNKGIYTITDAEPIGPEKMLDVLVIAPCTGNTLAKLCNGITDTSVLMAAKAHLRNERPLIISISTNDAMGINFKNLGSLYNMKNIYFVPFGQDNYNKKHNSLISHMELIPDTIKEALEGRQIQPVLRGYE